MPWSDNEVERRRQVANELDLSPEASWDQIYRAWRRRHGLVEQIRQIVLFPAMAAGAILIFGGLGIVALVFAVIVFLAIGFVALIVVGYGEEELYRGFVLYHPELEERSKRDWLSGFR